MNENFNKKIIKSYKNLGKDNEMMELAELGIKDFKKYFTKNTYEKLIK